jgi:hypothetical protein
VLRPGAARHARTAAVRDILHQLGPTHTNPQLADHLNQAGHLTGTGQPFDEAKVRWLRWQQRIPAPSPLADDELGVHELAQHLNVGDHVIYVWIRQANSTPAAPDGDSSRSRSTTTSRPPAASASPIHPEPAT